MEKKDIIPRLKKKISSFVLGEKGTISKHSMASIGTFVGTIVASGLLSAKDVDAAAITISSSEDGVTSTVTGTHSHHSSHSSHGSHGSHSNHSSSDRRLKKNIQEIPDALEKIQKLNGIIFEWKENDEKDIGLVAQNVEKVFPELVSADEKTGLKSLQYQNLVAPAY